MRKHLLTADFMTYQKTLKFIHILPAAQHGEQVQDSGKFRWALTARILVSQQPSDSLCSRLILVTILIGKLFKNNSAVNFCCNVGHFNA